MRYYYPSLLFVLSVSALVLAAPVCKPGDINWVRLYHCNIPPEELSNLHVCILAKMLLRTWTNVKK